MSAFQASSGGATAPAGAGQARPPWDWNRVLTVPAVLRMLPIVALLVAAYWRRIVDWEGQWRDNAAWGHGYLVPVIAVVIAHFRLKELNPPRIETCIWGLPVILAGCLVRIWSETLQFGYPGQVTFLVVTGGVILFLLGWPMFKALAAPVAFLGLMIPWNFKYYEGVALPLQNLGAAATGKILELIGYTRLPEALPRLDPVQALAYVTAYGKAVFLKGNAVDLLSGPLTVAEACSGLHLLFAFVALGVMTAFIYKRATWERVLIMVSSVPIAVFCNVIRVTLMALASDTIFFEEGRLAAHAASWSTWAPRIVAWPATAWVGVIFAGGSLFLLATHGGTDKLARHLSPWRLVVLLVLGVAGVLVTAKIVLGYPSAADLELARQAVLDPNSAPHQAFGFAMLGLAFALMWVELRVIDLFFIEEKPAEGRAPPAS